MGFGIGLGLGQRLGVKERGCARIRDNVWGGVRVLDRVGGRAGACVRNRAGVIDALFASSSAAASAALLTAAASWTAFAAAAAAASSAT